MTTTDARKRNTEPRDQEHTMTSPTQRRHDELLAEIRDALKPDYVIETRTCRKAEPVDVTEEPPVHIVCGVCGERPDSLLGHVDCAPGVGPDEARDDPDAAWRQVAKIMEERAEHYAAEAKANNEVALSRLADVERLTRERDFQTARADDLGIRVQKAEGEVRYLTREREDLRERVDELIRERGQAIERYRALRQDAVGEHLHARDGSKAEASLAYVLTRDDERGRDA